ncbi:MAG TPA: hypothetical protein VFG68_04465 [Fimbriiglobus sp.]|nr:hypothetical protein [Fimbriiglobus sp.]
MNAIHIHKTLDSDTLHLPELRPLIGRRVEIVVREEQPAAEVRDQFYAELARAPETAEAFAAQQATYRRWRADPRFEAYWPTLDHLLARDFASARRQAERWAAIHEEVRRHAVDGSDRDHWDALLRDQYEADVRDMKEQRP